MASTMVMGVNLSTDVGKTAASTILRVSCPLLRLNLQGPRDVFSSQKRSRFLAGGEAIEGLGVDLVKSHVTGVTLVTL
jgi:hypothetical protein